MYYKNDIENNMWYKGREVRFPNGIIIKDGNPQSYDGWEWLEEPPQEYLDWLIRLELEEETQE